MVKSRIHLIVATPCFGGQLTSAYFFSLLRLQEAFIREGLQVTILLNPNDPLITRARQDMAAKFLEIQDATHLLFVDADIQFEPEQVFRLLKFNAEITAGAYPLKRVDWARVKALVMGNYERPQTGNLRYVVELDKPAVERDGFGKARYAGTGFLMIRREALLAMVKHYPELSYSGVSRRTDPLAGSPFRSALFDCLLDEKTRAYLSEDYSFCRRWTDMGGEIWVDLRSRLSHVGQMTFEGDFLTRGHAPSGIVVRKAAP